MGAGRLYDGGLCPEHIIRWLPAAVILLYGKIQQKGKHQQHHEEKDDKKIFFGAQLPEKQQKFQGKNLPAKITSHPVSYTKMTKNSIHKKEIKKNQKNS